MEISLHDSLKIDINIGSEIEHIDLREDLKINDKDLAGEFVRQPSLFSWYSALLTDQEAKLGEARFEALRYKAGVVLALRQGKKLIVGTDGKAIKITDSVADSYTINDDMCSTFQEEVQRLEVIVKKLKVLRDASIQRKDMLMQVGALKRAEMEQFGTFPSAGVKKI